MRILMILTMIILSSCKSSVELDFSKNLTACTNIYDSKDDIIFYDENKSSFESMTTGVIQYTYIDVYQDRRMLNEFEIENFKCVKITSTEQYNTVVND